MRKKSGKAGKKGGTKPKVQDVYLLEAKGLLYLGIEVQGKRKDPYFCSRELIEAKAEYIKALTKYKLPINYSILNRLTPQK